MSVLACNRNSCENVMCDYYSHRFGYLCSYCFEELNQLKPKSYEEIEAFMDSSERKQTDSSLDLNEIFELR